MRAIYFGTNGCAGHYAVPIVGDFSHEEIKDVERIDCDNFYSVFKGLEFKTAKYLNYTIFGFPASPDDPRGGSKTVVMIDGEASIAVFEKLIDDSVFLKGQFDLLSKIYNTSWKINLKE